MVQVETLDNGTIVPLGKIGPSGVLDTTLEYNECVFTLSLFLSLSLSLYLSLIMSLISSVSTLSLSFLNLVRPLASTDACDTVSRSGVCRNRI